MIDLTIPSVHEVQNLSLATRYISFLVHNKTYFLLTLTLNDLKKSDLRFDSSPQVHFLIHSHYFTTSVLRIQSKSMFSRRTQTKTKKIPTDPAFAFTTSVPAFWMRSVSFSVSSSVKDAFGEVLKTNNIIRAAYNLLWLTIITCILRWFPHNIRAIMAKIKVPKNPHSMVTFWIKVRRSYQDLSSQADPARENWTWSFIYFI